MNSTSGLAGTVAVADGDGRIVRRSRCLLFVAAGDHVADLADRFRSAASDSDAVVAALGVLHGGTDAVVVSWFDEIRIIVSGALEARTDDEALAMMSAAASSTWVERRLPAGTLRVSAGGPAVDDTELGHGSVRAGGFELRLEPSSPDSDDRPSPSGRAPDGPSGADVGPTGDVRADTADDEWDDWMEDSLGIRPIATGTSGPADAVDPIVDATKAPEPSVDLERTVGPDGSPLPGAPRVPEWPGDVRDDGPPGRDLADQPHPEPVDEATPAGDLDATVSDRTSDAPDRPVVVLRLDDGRTVVVDDIVVVGRRPSTRSDATGLLIDEPGVSRLHLEIRRRPGADASVVVVDLGSRSGTAVVPPQGEPVELTPGEEHETPVGSMLLIGGPTRIHVESGE